MGFLAICPKVRATDDGVVARTSACGYLVSLTMLWRRVTVDRRARAITVRARVAWAFVSERRIDFDDVARIEYAYNDANVERWFAWGHDALDWFSVGLRLKPTARHPDGERVHLFHFVGEGHFTNAGPLPDWWYWDETAIDLAGTQDDDSREFVKLLERAIGRSMSGRSRRPPRHWAEGLYRR